MHRVGGIPVGPGRGVVQDDAGEFLFGLIPGQPRHCEDGGAAGRRLDHVKHLVGQGLLLEVFPDQIQGIAIEGGIAAFNRDKTGRFPFGRVLLQGLSLGGKTGFQFCVVHGVIPPCVHIALTEKRR